MDRRKLVRSAKVINKELIKIKEMFDKSSAMDKSLSSKHIDYTEVLRDMASMNYIIEISDNLGRVLELTLMSSKDLERLCAKEGHTPRSKVIKEVTEGDKWFI